MEELNRLRRSGLLGSEGMAQAEIARQAEGYRYSSNGPDLAEGAVEVGLQGGVARAFAADADVRDAQAVSPTPGAVTVYVLSRTGNGTAPLHLVEAALVAGANHIVAATAPMTDEVADRVLARVLVLLGVLPSASAAGMAPSQALQGALQQFDRAFPYPSEDLTDWPIVHVGLPGSAG